MGEYINQIVVDASPYVALISLYIQLHVIFYFHDRR